MTELVEVVVGKVGRAHGIRGDVAIDLRTDEPGRRFFAGAKVESDSGRQLTVERTTWQRGRLLVTFAGYPDRTAVETLTGEVLSAYVPAGELPSADDEYFDRQLVGLAVLDHRGENVGTVREVLHLPAQDVLEVKAGDEVRLVPFVRALVPVVDLDSGTLQLADVPGLLEDIE